MRKLIYVPIIHTNADFGSFAQELDKRGRALTNDLDWEGHNKTVLGFWDSIDHYFEHFEVKNLKIYQDGLVADEEIGRKIISEGRKQGSRNFEIVSKLMDRGAQLVKTENFHFVKKEYDYLKKIVETKNKMKKVIEALIYKLRKKKLLKNRDDFIAQTINETLKQGETAILFLGAEHEIVSKFTKDIEVIELKKREKIREYRKMFLKKNNEKQEQLVEYLTSPIEEDTLDRKGGTTFKITFKGFKDKDKA